MGGDYLWAVKDNQPGVKEAVRLLFEEPPWGERFGAASREGWHGDRWERRRLWAATALNECLDRTGTGLLRGTGQEAHGERAGGAGGRCPVAGDMARALGD